MQRLCVAACHKQKMKMRLSLVLFTLVIMIFGCKKSNQGEVLSGLYVETAPKAGAAEMNFISDNRVIITGDSIINQASASSDTFSYQIANKEILFVSKAAPKSNTTIFSFQQPDSNTFVLNACTCLCPCPNFKSLFFVKN